MEYKRRVIVSCEMVRKEGGMGWMTDPVSLWASVNGAHKEMEGTTGGEKKGTAEEHCWGKVSAVGRGKAREGNRGVKRFVPLCSATIMSSSDPPQLRLSLPHSAS